MKESSNRKKRKCLDASNGTSMKYGQIQSHSHNSDESLKRSLDPNQNERLQDDNSYPYLKLLGEICSLIKSEIGSESESHEEDFEFVESSKPLYLDAQQYPCTSLLQNLIHKANLNHPRRDFDKGENFHYFLKTMSYPLDVLPPVISDVKQKYLLDVPSCSVSNHSQNMTHASQNTGHEVSYASKLKHIACQMNSEERYCSFKNRGVSEVCSILRNLFPSVGDGMDLTYTEKLKNICDQVRVKDEFMDSETSFSTSSWEENSCDVKCEPLSNENSESYSFCPDKSQHRLQRFNFKENQEFISHNDSKDERFLFEALMKNVHSQSFLNHKNFLKDCHDEDFVVKQEPSCREFNPNILGEAGIKIIEQRFAKHLNNLNET